MPVIDRLIQPLVGRFDRMEQKLDKTLEHVPVLQAAQSRTDIRLQELETKAEAQALALAKTDGRNNVISWILGLLGAPLVVALAGAGIAKIWGLV